MTGIIIELCTRNKTDDPENHLEASVEFATCGLRALAVAYEVDSDDSEVEANGFELIGHLSIFDPREDSEHTIDDPPRCQGQDGYR